MDELHREMHAHRHGPHNGHAESHHPWVCAGIGLVFAWVATWACGFLKPEVKPKPTPYAAELQGCAADNPGQERRCGLVLHMLGTGNYHGAKRGIFLDPFENGMPKLTDAKTSWLRETLKTEHHRLMQAGDADTARRLREEFDADWLFEERPMADGS